LSYLEAFIIGIIQGLTEFLPVSSSGHIELSKGILGVEFKENLAFTIFVHGATALSTVVIFRNRLVEIFKGLLQFKNNEAFQYSLKIVLSMLPAAFVGLFFNDQIEALFSAQYLLVGVMLVLTGVLLFFADKAKITHKEVSYTNSLLVGISQAIAILPGISRSGATIATSVLLGIDKSKAAEFSFIMVLPLILGKMLKDLMSGDIIFSGESTNVFIIGFIAAFITGLFACKWMIALVKNSNLKYFAYYCLVLGGLAILSQVVL